MHDDTARPCAVLLVDDDRQLTKLWAQALEIANMRPAIANTVEEASIQLKENVFDVVVVDIFFRQENLKSSANGIRLLAKLNLERLELEGPHPKVVLVSGSTLVAAKHEQIVLLGINFRVDNVLVKPFGVNRLVDTIRSLVTA